MTITSPKIDFDVLLDDSLENLCTLPDGFPTSNKKLLSLVNDFEEGKWRYTKFRQFVWNNIVEAALSFNERKKLIDKPQTQLEEAAKNLRLSEDQGKGSELAEILLYGIMKRHYGAIVAVPKIYYKQNTQDYAKGADSVHIVLEEDKKFSLWLGEAKFYQDINQAMGEAIKSIKTTLEVGKLKKESQVITGVHDLDEVINDPEVTGEIKKLLSPETSIDLLKPVLHVPILLLYECKITKKATQFTDEYQEKNKK